jgi:hypothetical protein
LGVLRTKIRHRILSIGLVAGCGLLPDFALGQPPATVGPDSSPPAKGIGASGAVGVKVGGADVQRAGGSPFVGVDLDLGRFGGPTTRFQVEATFLRGGIEEFVELEDQTYSGHIYDLTGSIAVVQLLRPPSRRVQPFLSAALSVHAMSSSFGSTILDRRYNTNNFGVQAGAGFRVRLGSRGSRALEIEARKVGVEDMNRFSVSVGLLWLLRDLAVPLG